eukprot:Skav235205  [mRNA]  locus=scaffold4495:81930:84990:- [translate_table: standard]
MTQQLRTQVAGPMRDWWKPCALVGGTCRCVGTLVFSTILGDAVREINSDGEVSCTAEALGAPASRNLKMCWCQEGLEWDNDVRKGLASLVRQGLTPRVEVASDESLEPGCDASSDGQWYGCVVMSRRWDTTVIPQVMARTAPAEEQLDMALRKLDACHRLSPGASLRVLGVRSGQATDAPALPVRNSRVCSVVYQPDEGVTWTAHTPVLHCATEPGTCTTTPCECRKSSDKKLELRTPQGRRCWACSESGKEYTFRVNALAEHMEGQSVSWWPPYGINSPPILWIFMDFWAVVEGCPIITGYMFAFFCCMLIRKAEEFSGGLIPWTRCVPIFGPAVRRGEVWRFFTFTFFHLNFMDLFQNLLTLLDTLDVEATPSIILGDGSNLKCGVGAKQNFMCYPSIGLGSFHTLGVALVSAAIGGMCSTWMKFADVVAGASALGFGLSGAIVALYALYAGADLDSTSSVQRSFKNWVWLRLIFVAFHIAMEFVRGLSQRDIAGLWAHTTAFISGFVYVLYFLPPMGDGTLLSAERPYVVACAYDSSGFSSSAPECVRLFSSQYEYPVVDVQRQAFLFFSTVIGWTVFNAFVLQRKNDTPGVLLAGSEVSAVCCNTRKARGGEALASNMENKEVVLWCEVLGTSWRPPVGTEEAERQLVARCLNQDPYPGGLLDLPAESEAKAGSVQGKELANTREFLFLPVMFKPKGSFIQFVLYDLDPVKKPVAFASITLSRALGSKGEQRLRLQPLEAAKGSWPKASGCLPWRVSPQIAVKFQYIEPQQAIEYKERAQTRLHQMKAEMLKIQEQLDDLRKQKSSLEDQ